MDEREELMALRRLAELEARSAAAPDAPKPQGKMDAFVGGLKASLPAMAGAGLYRGFRDVTDTVLGLGASAADAVAPKANTLSSIVTGERPTYRAAADAASAQGKADYDATYGDSPLASTFRLGGNIAATLPVGGVLAKGVEAIPKVGAAVPQFVNALRTGGMRTGAPAAATVKQGAVQLANRMAGGAGTGFASAGLVNPDDAGLGAIIGGALPGATKVAGVAGNLIGKGARATGRAIVGDVAPEVVALAQRAKALGIDIPADRLVNSKALNATAASLNYVPFSGRAGTEEKMLGSMNRALSRTFGQDSDNVTMALRKAGDDLGGKFEAVLQNNTVKMTPAFKTALADAETQAASELGAEAASVIHKQIALIQTKGAAGEIDGQAAYNIKKALDRIGSGNSDAAFYARDLKQKLMDALNESLGPAEAKAFAGVRQQYGNMLALENLAQNGAEGGVSVGRLANLKHINNPDLQELADIAAQFLRTRESPHGAAQRLVIGGVGAVTAGGAGMLPMLPAVVGAGRGANALLNSNAARNAVLGTPSAPKSPNALQRLLANSDLAQIGYRAAPVTLTGR